MSAAPLTLGTAGHIDHGKTALIAALTGVDTDRLPQEQARGISIELGYASLELPSGRRLSVVDVPGHERFVRTMVAGATGIDLYLMVVAADDGVMPQTREHAAVLAALGVQAGVVAVTKADLADHATAQIEASELLPGVDVVAVSARTGDGLAALLAALDRVAQSVASRADTQGPARLHIDRVFTIRGAGTVVTGTLWSGSIARADTLELLPGGRRVRVRGVQVHGEPLAAAGAGQRIAVNLTGIGLAEISRGQVLTAAGSEFRATYLIDAELTFGPDEPAPGDRVQIHHGTRETPARLAWLGGRFWQLRLEQALVPAPGDRLVVRRIAPPATLGGGAVLDAHPRKHGPSRELTAALERLARGEPRDDTRGETGGGTRAETRGATRGETRGEPDGPRESNRSPQPGAATGPAGPPPSLSPSALELERRLRDAGAEPPADSELDPTDLAALRSAGRAVRVSKTLHYHPDALAAIQARAVALARRDGGRITLAGLRDELGTSRKFAQALLEHLDSARVTIRRGDEHFLRRAVD
jgi:selenocysteine-specific elongation factor